MPPATAVATGPARGFRSISPSFFYIWLCGVAFLIKLALHVVPEGHVGLYYRAGRLMRRVTNPGLHMRVPLLDHFAPIQVTLQTDKVENIVCGTKSGVPIRFEKIEVVNRLRVDAAHAVVKEFGVDYDQTWIFDKIHHEINQFCSSHTLQEVYIDMFDQVDDRIRETLQLDIDTFSPGLEIISVRVTKPKIPDAIAANYINTETQVERTKALVATERAKVEKREAETEAARAVAEAEKHATTSRIVQEQLLAERRAHQEQETITNEVYLAKQRALADAEAYRLEREAEANASRLTPAFLEYAFIQAGLTCTRTEDRGARAVTTNSKIYFGDKLPSMFVEQRLMHDQMASAATAARGEAFAGAGDVGGGRRGGGGGGSGGEGAGGRAPLGERDDTLS
ncbi:hypothetical protein FOA52_013799 [Chlamydomonas sp. UWO 241]|nr:hypothetical protein FOA52_013799 [Chlamydomonas sp. UWO 241]